MPFVVLVLGGVGVALITLATASAIHHHRARRYLFTTLKVDEEQIEEVKERFASSLGIAPEDIVIPTSIALWDVLYNITKMDPHALKGIAHLHHSQQFESLRDLADYMKENIITMGEGTQEWRQMIHKYKGYTGEEAIIEKLQAEGHVVEVPGSGTQERYDAVVDGQPINIKITDNPAYIHEHLDKYPDIPVYTNKEMAGAFGDHPMVTVVQDVSAQDMFHETADTMEGIDGLGNFIDHIPLVTLVISTLKNTTRFVEGKKDLATACEHVLCDTLAVGGGAFVGAKVGLGVGLMLAPFTGGLSVLIPAATSTIGVIIGILTGKSIVQWFKERHLRRAVEALKTVAADFRNTFIEEFHFFTGCLNEHYGKLAYGMRKAANEVERSPVKRLLFPSALVKFYQMAKRRVRKELRQVKRGYQELLEKIHGYEDEAEGGLVLYYQGANMLLGHEELLRMREAVAEAVEWVEREKEKLS